MDRDKWLLKSLAGIVFLGLVGWMTAMYGDLHFISKDKEADSRRIAVLQTQTEMHEAQLKQLIRCLERIENKLDALDKRP